MKRSFWVGLVALLSFPALLGAQARSTGSISGFVEDETGARLPGVTVTAESPAHIRAETTVTDERGFYRLSGLTPGLYTVTAALSGFATVVREGVRVDVGQDYRLDMIMKVAAVAETVTVVGESPVVDPKSSTVRTNYQYEFLQNIPQPRAGTGAAILRLAPGVDASTSVGGAAGTSAVAWLFDGVDVSDPGGGAQFPFYNYDYIEESEIVTYGAPAEYGKFAGAVFNVVTKSGGIDYHGSANLYYTGEDLVSSNIEGINKKFEDNPNFSPLEADKIIKRWDGTFNMGGPIVPNKLHFFGGIQQIIDDTIEAGTPSPRTDRSTRLLGKLTWQVNPENRISGFYEFDRFPIDGRGPESPDPNTRVKEPSPNTTPRLHWQYTPTENAVLEVQYSGFYGFFDLEPRNNLPGIYDTGSGFLYQSYYGFYHFGRSRTEVKSDYTQYVDDYAGRHEIKFGVGYELGIKDDEFEYGKNALGQNVLYYSYFGEIYGGSTRLGDFRNKTANKVLSFYAQDSWTLAERVTLNLGIRYDRSTAHFSTPDVDAFTFNDISPRLFATIDLTGDGKTVVRGGWGRYYEALFGNLYDNFDPSLPRSAFFLFTAGPGGCGTSAPGFPNIGGGPECFSGIDAPNVEVVSISDPLATIGIDPDLENHYTDQTFVGFERELFPDFSFSVFYIHKEDSNLFAGRDTKAVFEPTTIEDPLTGQEIPAWFRTTPADESFRLLTNRNDLFFRRYNGLQLQWQKRWRNNWQLIGSWTIQKAEGTHQNDSDSATRFDGANPNDLINFDGELLNSRRHVFKLQGSYRVPYIDTVVGWLVTSQSGRTYNRIIRARLPNRVSILAEPRGSRRLDTLNTVDLRLEKRLRFGQRSELGILVDIFNLFNDAAIDEVNETTGDSFELPQSVSSPREVQFGIRWMF